MRWQHPFRLSIRAYLMLSYVVFILGGLTVTGLFWFSQQESAAEGSLLLQLQERARLLTTINEMQLPPKNDVLLPGTVAAINENLKVFFFTSQQQVRQLSFQKLTNDDRNLAVALTQEVWNNPLSEPEAEKRWVGSTEILYASSPVYSPNQEMIGVVCLILPLDDFRSSMQFYRWELVQLAAGLAVLSLLVGIILAHILSKPIHQAKDMAARVAGGDYHIRLPSQGPKELKELEDSLNDMAGELELQGNLRQQLLSNITHELARPLGAISLGIESLSSGAMNDPEFSEDLLGEIDRTLKDVEAMIEDLALAARPSQVPLQLNVQSVALEPFLNGIRSRYSPLAESRGIRLRFDIPCDLPSISADEVRLSQILGNLLDNSLKFCQAGGEVQVIASDKQHGMALCVQDTGPGIPIDEHHKVIQPFYQGKNGRLVRQGMGLGLSIVFQLVHAHSGKIKLENVPGGGLLVTIWMPYETEHAERSGLCSSS
jgi:two-component system, OmpR family, sensor histidine kinase BaeS